MSNTAINQRKQACGYTPAPTSRAAIAQRREGCGYTPVTQRTDNCRGCARACTTKCATPTPATSGR